VETPHLSCIAQRAVMDGTAVKTVPMKYHGGSKNLFWANTATLSSI